MELTNWVVGATFSFLSSDWFRLGAGEDIMVMVFTKWIGPKVLMGFFTLDERCLKSLLGLLIFTGEVG